MDEAEQLLGLAAENLASSVDNLAHRPPRRSVSYAEARHALELACKVLLLRKTGGYRRDHK
ncbi:MAG: hypothetical protein LC623_05940, partial [Halobacteriales archaeon]|nr:hypothetical protein [Halobacteriales archaeon]